LNDGDISKVEASACRRADAVAAYLDGEMDASESQLFDAHLRECPACVAALGEQKRLLCLFDAAFDETFDKKFDLPRNFAQVVTARAQTDMSGVRRATEHRRALALGALLGVASFALLGATIFDEALAPFVKVADTFMRVLAIVWHALADAGSGAAVILRTIGNLLIAEPYPFRLLTWFLFAGAVVVLLRLIGSYHRRRDAN
jgi:anti-sigma factor RsiW